MDEFDFMAELAPPRVKRRVVHCKRAKHDVYIGRGGIWGNPFEIGRDGTRDEVIEKYRTWVVTQPHLVAQFRTLMGKTLGCWCAPSRCHGDVLVDLAEHHKIPDSASLKILDGDILRVTRGVVCQQVNCRGRFGKGLVKQTAEKYPEVERAYFAKKNWHLGDTVFVKVGPELYFGLLAGQDRYGEDKCYTDYKALASTLEAGRKYSQNVNLPMSIPHGIGCGLAGGDWSVVTDIISIVCPDSTIYRFQHAK